MNTSALAVVVGGMEEFEHGLILILLLTTLSVLGRRLPWPLPITYVVGAGLVALFWHQFPQIKLDPGFFMLCFMPPLLFSDGWLMPLRDFMANKRAILTLAIGLVIFTTVAIGLIAHWLIPGLPLAMAFALGAVVSPTDAVAVSAITHRLKVPRRLTTILNGESLMNDATGLVAFKFALAAVIAGTFSIKAAAISFTWLAVGGTVVGLAIGWLVGRVRDLLRSVNRTDQFIETTLSLLTPYATYLAAEHLGLSSILAVVAAGLYSGFRDPIRTDATTRHTSLAVWSVVLFWMNGLAFVLLGLQLPSVLASVSQLHPPLQLALFTAVIAGAAILTRLVWVFPGAYIPFFFLKKAKRLATRPPWQAVAVTGWAGMRGTITLAAALSIPVVMPNGEAFPGRDMVIFLSLGVIMVTLIVQGTTLESLICFLGLRADSAQMDEERLARIAAVEAGLKILRTAALEETRAEETAAIGYVLSEYEHRLAELTAEGETRASAHIRRTTQREHRLNALRAERDAINDLWRRDIITDEIHHPLQRLLDHEETMLEDPKAVGAH